MRSTRASIVDVYLTIISSYDYENNNSPNNLNRRTSG